MDGCVPVHFLNAESSFLHCFSFRTVREREKDFQNNFCSNSVDADGFCELEQLTYSAVIHTSYARTHVHTHTRARVRATTLIGLARKAYI